MKKKFILLSMEKNTLSGGGAIMTPSSGSEKEKPFKGFNHGKGLIDPTTFLAHTNVVQALPTSIHLKEDGAKDGGPSVAIVMESRGGAAFGQLSLKMWNEGLKDIGYKIVKI